MCTNFFRDEFLSYPLDKLLNPRDTRMNEIYEGIPEVITAIIDGLFSKGNAEAIAVKWGVKV